MLLRKIKEGWNPQEKPGMEIGDTLEVTNAEALLRLGLAEVVSGAKEEYKVEEVVEEVVEEESKEEVKVEEVKCPNCGKAFASNSSLVKHKRFCDKNFKA